MPRDGSADKVAHRFLSDFGEEQISRIATQKAVRVNAAAGKYANYRYYATLLLELVQIGAFLGAAVGLVFLLLEFSWELARQAGLNLIVLILAHKGAEWCKPGVLTDVE